MYINKANIIVHNSGTFPTKGKPTDRCYDMYARAIIPYSGSTFYDKMIVHLGVSIQPDLGWAVNVYPRSSSSKHRWILSNCIGIGENNYEGEWLAVFDYVPSLDLIYAISKNLKTMDGLKDQIIKTFPYSVGDRPVQFELVPQNHTKLIQVNQFDPRGPVKSEGFGSSGK